MESAPLQVEAPDDSKDKKKPVIPDPGKAFTAEGLKDSTNLWIAIGTIVIFIGAGIALLVRFAHVNRKKSGYDLPDLD